MPINIDIDDADATVYAPANDSTMNTSGGAGDPATFEIRVPATETEPVLVYAEGLHSGYPANDGSADEGTGLILYPGDYTHIRIGSSGRTKGARAIHAKCLNAEAGSHLNIHRVAAGI